MLSAEELGDLHAEVCVSGEELLEYQRDSSLVLGTSAERKFVPISGRYFKQVTCYRCGKNGHTSRDCSTKVVTPCSLCGSLEHHDRCSRDSFSTSVSCFWCSSSVHRFSECTQFSARTDFASTTCYACGEIGHLNCKSKRIPLVKSSGSGCFTCGLKGHTSIKCRRMSTSKLVPARFYSGDANYKITVECYKCGEVGHETQQCHGFSQIYQDMHRNKRIPYSSRHNNGDSSK